MDTPKEENEFAVACRRGDQLAVDLGKLMKLPEHIISIEIKFEALTPPVVKCVSYYFPEKSSQDYLNVFSEFELIPKDPKPFSPSTKRENLLEAALQKIMSCDEDIKEEAEAILNTDFKEYARKIAEEAISKAHEL